MINLNQPQPLPITPTHVSVHPGTHRKKKIARLRPVTAKYHPPSSPPGQFPPELTTGPGLLATYTCLIFKISPFFWKMDSTKSKSIIYKNRPYQILIFFHFHMVNVDSMMMPHAPWRPWRASASLPRYRLRASRKSPPWRFSSLAKEDTGHIWTPCTLWQTNLTMENHHF